MHGVSMVRIEARARKFCFPNTPQIGLCSAQSRRCLTGYRKIVVRIPIKVKIGGVVSVGPTSWWSLDAKKLLAAHLRLC
jgi:hypothetical protein